jgi:hypothetical protein
VSESVITTITKTTRNKIVVDWSTSLNNPHKLKFDACITPQNSDTSDNYTHVFHVSCIYRPDIILLFHASFSSIHLQTHPPTTPMYFTPFVYIPNKVAKKCEN